MSLECQGSDKKAIRECVWKALEERGVALPPGPWGRIPNFRGAERAAQRIIGLEGWRRARVVKVNPDSPQRPVRLAALSEGKKLLMPTPRLRRGFLLLDPDSIPRQLFSQASTIKGAFKYGVLLDTIDKLLRRVDRVDFIVEGSVAVNRWGERLGKGEGYGELEYAILVELGLIERDVGIATSVHDLQLLERRLPQDPYDVPVDWVATPSRVVECRRGERPPGILWDLLGEEKLREIPLLGELRVAGGGR